MLRGFWLVMIMLVGGYPAHAQAPDGIPAQVISSVATVNAYVLPEETTPRLMLLNGGMQITALGRTPDNLWVQANLSNGVIGWVRYDVLETRYDYSLAALPPTQPDEEMILQYAPFWNFDTPHNRTRFERGRARGNTMNAFSKVGDSITAEPAMYSPLGYGQYDLGGYGYLQDTVTFFSQTSLARGANSFAHVSLAALPGWTTNNVLNPANADGQFCQAGESPLACEYRLSRPAVALIMLGSNDVTFVQAEQYANNLRRIVQISLDSGVIPVLSTIPPRRGYEERTDFYNSLIVQVAREYGVSLWDYGAAMRTLPNDGLSEDGLHPSLPPGGYENGANFTGDFLQYGYVLRNWMALHVLDALRTQVLR